MPLTVAVILCAYTVKRWDDIVEAHRSVLGQSVPPDEIVFVVDHNVQLLAKLSTALPDVQVTANTNKRGLSGARNTGVAATTADVVLFLDDDATADSRWVEQMVAPFQDDRVVGVGGWALPRWDAPGRPAWFPETFLWVVGSSYQGQSTTVGEIRNPLGCSMAFRRTALDATAGFSDGIGRVGTHPLGCEETELSIRIARALPGSVIMGVPDAVVRHRVTPGRMTVKYFVSRCYWEGVSKAVVASQVGAGAALASEKVYTTKVLPVAFFRGLGQGLRGRWSGVGQSLAIGAGLLVTSAGYLRGKRSAVAAPAGTATPTPTSPTAAVTSDAAAPAVSSATEQSAADQGSTIWCTETDLVSGPELLVPPAGTVGRARILVRSSGEPIEFVELPLTPAGLATDDIVAALSDRAAQRLATAPMADVLDPTVVPPLVSVVVCTRDRGPELAQCLENLAHLTYGNLEILIVDNAPTTPVNREVVQARVATDARFRYLLEPDPGLSKARNRGLTEARGEFIAYTDDDVAVDPNWVAALMTGFARRSDVGCVTGLVCTATLQTPAEHYFDQRVSWAESCEPRLFDLRSNADDPLYPYAAGLFGTGASMAFSTSLLREIGGWDEALGAGTRAKGGEDLDMFVRVLLDGHAIAYEPSAIVWHHHRSDLDGLRRQIFGYGTGLSAFLTKHLLDSGTRSDLLRRIPQGIAKAVTVPRGKSSDQAPNALAAVGSKRALIVREFAGMALGPALYAMARRDNRSVASDRGSAAS